jgi:hypothetical protein
MLQYSDMLHVARTAYLRCVFHIIYKIKYSPKQLFVVCLCVQTQYARCDIGIVTNKDWLWSASHSIHPTKMKNTFTKLNLLHPSHTSRICFY